MRLWLEDFPLITPSQQVACLCLLAALSHCSKTVVNGYNSGCNFLELLSHFLSYLLQCEWCPGAVTSLAVVCDFCHTSEQGLCFLCSGCEKTFITVSALFSHNRAHFREQELFSCSFPGCSKQYDKACRLKIHLRSHTGNELENTAFVPKICLCGSLHLWLRGIIFLFSKVKDLLFVTLTVVAGPLPACLNSCDTKGNLHISLELPI